MIWTVFSLKKDKKEQTNNRIYNELKNIQFLNIHTTLGNNVFVCS